MQHLSSIVKCIRARLHAFWDAAGLHASVALEEFAPSCGAPQLSQSISTLPLSYAHRPPKSSCRTDTEGAIVASRTGRFTVLTLCVMPRVPSQLLLLLEVLDL